MEGPSGSTGSNWIHRNRVVVVGLLVVALAAVLIIGQIASRAADRSSSATNATATQTQQDTDLRAQRQIESAFMEIARAEPYYTSIQGIAVRGNTVDVSTNLFGDRDAEQPARAICTHMSAIAYQDQSEPRLTRVRVLGQQNKLLYSSRDRQGTCTSDI